MVKKHLLWTEHIQRESFMSVVINLLSYYLFDNVSGVCVCVSVEFYGIAVR